MNEMKTGYILNVYFNLDEYLRRTLASEVVIKTLLDLHFPGASVFRSIESFGSHRHIEKSHLLSSEDDRGIIVQVVDDSQERLDALLLWLDQNLPGHLVTVTETRFRLTGPAAA